MQRAVVSFPAGAPLSPVAGPSRQRPLSPIPGSKSPTPVLLHRNDCSNTDSYLQQNEQYPAEPTAPAQHWRLPRIRSIPYSRTIQANPPRFISTVSSLNPLPRHVVAAHNPSLSSHRGDSGNENSSDIPNSFNIYIRTFHRHPRAYIAHDKEKPLYALSCTRRDVTLHRGCQNLSPAVASYVHPSFWSPRKRPAHILVVAAGGRSPPPPSGGVSRRSTEGFYKVTVIGGSPQIFTVNVPAPPDNNNNLSQTETENFRLRPETFEWRPSRGPAVAAGAGLSHGMKLVRLATDAGRAGGEIATGGGEVVAVYGCRWFSTQGFFMFQGTGAQGVLGDMFRVVAVMTAVGMWDQRRREWY